MYVLLRGHSNSAHAGLGGGGVIKMRANACMGEGGSRLCVSTFCFLNMLISMSDYDYPFSEALHRISYAIPIAHDGSFKRSDLPV